MPDVGAPEAPPPPVTRPSDFAPAPRTAEARKSPEVSRTRQDQEVEAIASNIFYRKINEIQAGSPPQPESPAHKLASLRELARANTFQTEASPDGLDMRNGNPVFVLINGERRHLLFIAGRSENSFVCTVDAGNGRMETVTLPEQDVTNGQLAAERDAILSLFTGQERAIVELHINSLPVEQGEKAFEGKTPEEINSLIKVTGEAAGMITTDTARALIETQATQAERAQAQKLFALLDGKNLLDPTTAVEIFKGLGFDRQSTILRAQQAEEKATQWREMEKKDPKNPAIKQEREQAEAQALLLRTTAGALAQGGVYKYFDRLYKGVINRDNATRLITAFKSGNLDDVFDVAMADVAPNAKDDAEKAQKKARMKEHMKKYRSIAGMGGAGILLALFFLSSQVMQ